MPRSGDGDQDLLVIAGTGEDRAARVLRNELTDLGELLFTPVADLAPNPRNEWVLANRLNHDSAPDVIVVEDSDEQNAGEVKILLSISGISTCTGDADGNFEVDFNDLVLLLAAWGPCPGQEDCHADFDDNGQVDFNDLVLLLAGWGPC
jgi:hypothetical protein